MADWTADENGFVTAPDGRIFVVTADGHTGLLPPEDLGAAMAEHHVRPGSPEEYDEHVKEIKYGDRPVAATALGAARGVTFGGSDVVARGLGLEEPVREIGERNRAYDVIGEGASYLTGAGAIGAVEKGAAKLVGAGATSLAGKVAQGAAREAITAGTIHMGQGTVTDVALSADPINAELIAAAATHRAETLPGALAIGAAGGSLGSLFEAASAAVKARASRELNALEGEAKAPASDARFDNIELGGQRQGSVWGDPADLRTSPPPEGPPPAPASAYGIRPEDLHTLRDVPPAIPGDANPILRTQELGGPVDHTQLHPRDLRMEPPSAPRDQAGIETLPGLEVPGRPIDPAVAEFQRILAARGDQTMVGSLEARHGMPAPRERPAPTFQWEGAGMDPAAPRGRPERPVAEGIPEPTKKLRVEAPRAPEQPAAVEGTVPGRSPPGGFARDPFVERIRAQAMGLEKDAAAAQQRLARVSADLDELARGAKVGKDGKAYSPFAAEKHVARLQKEEAALRQKIEGLPRAFEANRLKLQQAIEAQAARVEAAALDLEKVVARETKANLKHGEAAEPAGAPPSKEVTAAKAAHQAEVARAKQLEELTGEWGPDPMRDMHRGGPGAANIEDFGTGIYEPPGFVPPRANATPSAPKLAPAVPAAGGKLGWLAGLGRHMAGAVGAGIGAAGGGALGHPFAGAALGGWLARRGYDFVTSGAKLTPAMKATVAKGGMAIAEGMRGFAIAAPRLTRAAASPPPAAEVLKNTRLGPPSTDQEKPRKGDSNLLKTYNRLRGEVERAMGDPQGTMQRTKDLLLGVRDVDPALADQIAAVKQRKLEYAAATLPPRAPLSGIGRRAPTATSDAEAGEWLRGIAALEDPVGRITAELKSGRLSPSTVRAVKAVFPEVYARCQAGLIENLAEIRRDLPYHARLQIGILFEVPADSTLRPDFVAGMQLAFAAEPGTQGGQSAPSADLGDVAKQEPTEAQRLSA